MSVIDDSDVVANISHQLSPNEVLASKTTIDVSITAEPKIYLTVEPSVLPADGYSIAMVNSDGKVDISDLVLAARNFGERGENIEGDVNGDGEVNISDLALVAEHFGFFTP